MNKGSHGIGLNVCKRFAQQLGGDLYLNEDYSESGSEFILELCLARVVSGIVKRTNSEKEIG